VLSKTEPLTVAPFLNFCNHVDTSLGYTSSPWPVVCELTSRHNEPLEKALLTSENNVFGGLLTFPNMRSLIVAHSTRSLFSASRLIICLVTFSTASTIKLKGGYSAPS
jgi:hypothetical protein